MASIGWIDFSRDHRDRIGSVLDLLKAEGVVDELGLGTLRDGLANELFPGLSTIQTRARYFFLIPYLLQDYQAMSATRRRGKSPSRWLEEQENELMWDLAERYRHEDGHGVIGITKYRPNKIARRPSAIFWNGLYTYLFIDTGGLPAETFLKQSVNPSLQSLLATEQTGDDAINDDKDAGHESIFRIKVPRKATWKENLTLDLDCDEAEFFADRICTLASDKLIAALLRQKHLWEVFAASNNFMEFAKAASNLPMAEPLRQRVILAHDFSELMYGVHLAYNCQLQKKAFGKEFYEEEWNEWVKSLPEEMMNYERFIPDNIFALGNSRDITKLFVREWWQQARLGFRNVKQRDLMIREQEGWVKRSKARLQHNHTDDVRKEQWMGLSYFDYRFNVARTIISDIRIGLTR